jgi:hypothetical protein
MPPICDPLMQGVELPFHARFYPLGFPLDIATNSQLVVEGVAESWRCFPKVFDAPLIRLRVAVQHGDQAAPLPPEPVSRAQEHLLTMVAGSDNFAICDMAGAFGFCWLTAAVASDRDYMRYHFLDSMVYAPLEYQRLTSVHAACVALNGRGLLLSGGSGAGKSCLAFACAKSGWSFIADDGSALVRGSDDNLAIGNPYHIRFRESAIALFPELSEVPRSTTRNGEVSIEVSTSNLPIRSARSCQIERVVFLERGESECAELVPIGADEAARRLESELPFFGEQAHQSRLASLRRLLRLNACALRYGDLDSAVRTLAELVQGGDVVSGRTK